MSGPKCVGLSASERHRVWLDNQLRCDALLARYARLVHERDGLIGDAAAVAPDLPSMRHDVAELLKVWYDCEAVAYLEKHLDMLRGEIDTLRAAREGNRVATGAPAEAEESPSVPAKVRSAEEIAALRQEAAAGDAPSLAEALRHLQPAPGAAPVADPLAAKLAGLLARLDALEDDPGGTLAARVEAVRREADPAHRRRLYEALVLDAGQRLDQARRRKRQHEHLDELADELAPCRGAEAGALRDEVAALRAGKEVVSLDNLRARIAEAVAAERARREREHRRRAVLDSLAELGYETREGMETALVEGGRVVVRRAEESEYAVEVVANDDLSLLQTSMVRIGSPGELTDQQRLRDREREAAWCQDHAALLQRLADLGIETGFRLKLDPGAHPVRVIPAEDAPAPRRRESDRPAPREREI